MNDKEPDVMPDADEPTFQPVTEQQSREMARHGYGITDADLEQARKDPRYKRITDRKEPMK